MSGITPWYRFKRRNNRRSRLAMFVLWTVVPWLLIPIWRVLYGFRIRHRERCPRRGPVLAVCNHQAMLDPMIAGLALRERGFRPLARQSLRDDSRWLIGWLICRYDAIFVDRDAPGPSSLKDVLTELKNDRVSILFPEGTRSEDGTIGEFQPGIWLLIRRGNAPILPMAVEGVRDVLPPGGKLKWRGCFEVIMGTPIPADTLVAMGREAALQHLREVIDDLRMDLRQEIRSRTGGRWPLAGPADRGLRETSQGTSPSSASAPMTES
ncbi:MAG: lysophospholipid acyltransferase family protein [Planctomycetota bacterium]|nr:lysophospholipid acyltransferase family protein [Planctomycetota bacterium]